MLHGKLSGKMMPFLQAHDARISAAGIRYGSVAYVTFGEGIKVPHKLHQATVHYPVEIEFGADQWQITRNGDLLMNSSFIDLAAARSQIASILVGKRLLDIVTSGSESRVDMDQGFVFKSSIVEEPASGFLYSFQTEEGVVWETVDGVSTE